MKKQTQGKDRETRREEALRPNRCLGYDHAQIAVHLIGREAYSIAEKELKRAIWLNPYEPDFKLHLALCLYRQERFDEAKEMLDSIKDSEKHRLERGQLLDLIQKSQESKKV